MSTATMSTGGLTTRVVVSLDKCVVERDLKIGGDDGRIELHEEEGEDDEDEDAGDRRRIERWLEEQCRFGSMLGLGLDRESEVGLDPGENFADDGGSGGGNLGLGLGVVRVGGIAGGPSRADSPLLGFGWHWDSPEAESLSAPPTSAGLLATQPDASAPIPAYPSGVPSLSMSLSSTPSSSFTTVSSTAEAAVTGAHVKNNSNSSNQAHSPTTTTTVTTLDGTAKWGRSRSQSTASMLDSTYFHPQRPQAPLHQQNQPMPISPLPPSSPPTRRQSRAPSVSVVSSSVVPPLPPIALHSALPNASNNVKSRSRAGSTSLTHLAGDARNAVYIDSEEVRERLDELLMGGGLEEMDGEDEEQDEMERGEESRVGATKERTTTPYASPYQTPEASSSQVYIGHHSRAPSAASVSASSSKQVSRKGSISASVSVPLSRKGSVLGGSPSISRKPSSSSTSLSRKASMSMKRTESYQSVGHSHSHSHSQAGSAVSLREHAHAHAHSHSRGFNHTHNHSKSSVSAPSHPHSRAHSTATAHSASPSISHSLSSITSAAAPIPAGPTAVPLSLPISVPLSVPVPIQLPTQPGPRPTRPPPAPPLDLALVGNLVLAALEESTTTTTSSAVDGDDESETVELGGLTDEGPRLTVTLGGEGGDEMRRYSRLDGDSGEVGSFPFPPAHLPFAPPPTPLSPPMLSPTPLGVANVHENDHVEDDHHEEVVVLEGGEGGEGSGHVRGVRHAQGMTSRWSLASSIEDVEGKKSAKDKEKEKRKSFVAFVAAVTSGGASSADAGIGGLEVPGGASASGENLRSDKESKDPKEKKRGRLASFISRLSYSGGSANAVVSPVSEVPPPLPPMPTATTPPSSPTPAQTKPSTKQNQYKQQFQQPPPLMQHLAAMGFDSSSAGLLPSPEIRSSKQSDEHDRDASSSIKTREVKGVWEPVLDGASLLSPPPKLRARSNSAADLLSSSRMVAQEYQFQRQHHQHQPQYQQQQQRWPHQQYADVGERDVAPPPPMRGRSSSAADLLGVGFARRVESYQQQQQQQYQRQHPASHSQATPFVHATTSFDAEAPSKLNSEVYTRPPLHKSASASILRSTPSPLGHGHGHPTIPRIPSRPPPPPPKSKAMMMRIQTGFRGVDGAVGPGSPLASGGNSDEDENERVLVDGDEEAAVVEEEDEDEEEEDEDEDDYGVVVSRQNDRMHEQEEERWLGGQDESYPRQHPQQHLPQHLHQQQPYPQSPNTPLMSPRPSLTLASPKFPMPSAQAIKVENALMALGPSLPSLSSPHSQPPYGQQYYHPNESSSSDGNQQIQMQTQGRGGLSLTTRLRSMSSLGNMHPVPPSPASTSALASASTGSPALSVLSPTSPLGLPSSPSAPPSTPTVPGNNNKENVGGKGSGGGGGGGALSTLLLGIQKKAPKRKLVVSGVAMEDVDAYEAVKRWCEGFGQVRDISRAPNGCLYVDFKKASVAETVCRIQAQVYIKGAGSVSLDWYTKKPPV